MELFPQTQSSTESPVVPLSLISKPSGARMKEEEKADDNNEEKGTTRLGARETSLAQEQWEALVVGGREEPG